MLLRRVVFGNGSLVVGNIDQHNVLELELASVPAVRGQKLGTKMHGGFN